MSIRAVLAIAALVLSTVLLPTSAAASGLEVACTGTETATYGPGLLLTDQSVSVTVNGILAPCTSSDPAITSGTYLQSFTATLSCTTLLAGLAATRVFHWNNGESSTFSYHRVINNVAGQITVTFTGTITSGRFTGATAIQQVLFTTPNPLQCLTPPGLTSIGPGVSVLTITS